MTVTPFMIQKFVCGVNTPYRREVATSILDFVNQAFFKTSSRRSRKFAIAVEAAGFSQTRSAKAALNKKCQAMCSQSGARFAICP
jgi:hypothetical protein